jgi:uncharacterized coiled-coil protein SlyX
MLGIITIITTELTRYITLKNTRARGTKMISIRDGQSIERRQMDILNEIVTLTKEVVELQQENDKLQKQMIALSEKTNNLSKWALAVAVLAIVIPILSSIILRF